MTLAAKRAALPKVATQFRLSTGFRQERLVGEWSLCPREIASDARAKHFVRTATDDYRDGPTRMKGAQK